MGDLTDAIVDTALARLKPWTDSQYGDLFAIAAERAVRIVLMEAESVYRADERAKVSEDIATALLAVDPIEWALAGQSAGEDAAAIARRHAQPAQIDTAARKGQGATGGKHDPSERATADDRDDRQEQ